MTIRRRRFAQLIGAAAGIFTMFLFAGAFRPGASMRVWADDNFIAFTLTEAPAKIRSGEASRIELAGACPKCIRGLRSSKGGILAQARAYE